MIAPTPRFNPFRSLEIVVALIFVFALLATVFVTGPSVEPRFFPVVSAKITQTEEIGDRLRFYIEGEKLRGCQLDEASFSWRFDHTVMPAAVSDENGQPRPAFPIIQEGQRFIAGPFYALIPMAARLAQNLRLSRTYYYRCHVLWLTEYDLEVSLDLSPPVPVNIPSQSPTVRILPK